MRSLDSFIVKIPKRFNDTIELANGLSLYVDTRFDEFKHRVNEAEIISVPHRFSTGASPGDILYFHHHVVVNDGQPITGEEDTYMVKYSEQAVENQAIAYRPANTKDVIPIGGWTVLSPVADEEELKSDTLELVKLKEKPFSKGKVAYNVRRLQDLGVKVGDVVGFNPKFGYKFKIDGEVYLRIRLIDLLYVEND
jgi:co-chaperonin GroES (HSP10)